MKRIIFLTASLAMLAANVQCSSEDPIYRNVAGSSSNGDETLYYPEKPSKPTDTSDGFAPEGYELIWSDEFDDKSSLLSKWTFEKGGTGWGNNELQYYCAGGIFPSTGQQTARIDNGKLLITAYKVDPSGDSDNCAYVSARMNTKRTWQYGYIEMRAKLPTVGGTWPAFWMLPEDGQYHIANGGGELDIMEWVGNEPGMVWFSAHCQHVTTGSTELYVDPATGQGYKHSSGTPLADPGTEYHCFGLEWTHEYVKAYLDGKLYHYSPNPKPDENDVTWWPFDKPYYIKLNLAIGGSWGGVVDPSFTSATYEIDWVRVFQKSN